MISYTCTKCLAVKPASEFYGRNRKCKRCYNGGERRGYTKHLSPEQRRALQLERFREGKTCSLCKILRPISEFYWRNTGHLTSRCRSCDTQVAVKWQRSQRFQSPEQLQRAIARLEKTLEAYKALLVTMEEK